MVVSVRRCDGDAEGMTTIQMPHVDDEVRQAAITRLRKKRDFRAHLLAFVMVNLLLNGIWLATGAGSFYWPVFPLFGWGIGLAFHAWDAYGAPVPTEEQIQKEIRKLTH